MIELILIAVSLCADCFAVSLCSSITLKEANRKYIFWTAIAFAVIQSGLLLCGWLFGNVLVGLVEKITSIIAFLLLLYVGGGMLWNGIKNKTECRNLNGLRNVILGGIATSIDALAVGVAQSMNAVPRGEALLLCLFVFIVTFLSVVFGVYIGQTIACKGKKLSRIAVIAGGVILIAIGFSILIN